MKKIASLILAICCLPILFFAGCGETQLYEKTGTSKTGANFFNSILNSISDFYDFTQTREFNMNDLKQDSVYKNYTDAWSTVLNLNKQVGFGFMAYNMNELNSEFGIFDLSFLGGDEGDNLDSFFLEQDVAESTDNLKYYYHHLSGTETSAFMPKPIIENNIQSYLDGIDDGTIDEKVNVASWGNWLQFRLNVGSSTVEVNPVFKYPTALEVPNYENTELGLKVVRDNSKQRITVVYSVEGVVHSKIVSFITTTTTSNEQTVSKQVDCYDFNVLEQDIDPNVMQKQYVYLLDTSVDDENSTPILCGKYTINFDAVNSHIHCKTPGVNSTKSRSIEIFKTKTNEIITRFFKPIGVSIQQVDLILYADGISGNLKTQTATNIKMNYIEDDYLFDKTYADITPADSSGVNSVTQFLLKNNTVQIKRVNI